MARLLTPLHLTTTRLNDDGPRELQRDPEDGAKIVIAAVPGASGAGAGGGLKRPRPHSVFGGDEGEDGASGWGKKTKAGAAGASGAGGGAAGGKKSELERLMEMDAQRKQREEAAAASKAAEERTENWLSAGTIVKVGRWALRGPGVGLAAAPSAMVVYAHHKPTPHQTHWQSRSSTRRWAEASTTSRRGGWSA